MFNFYFFVKYSDVFILFSQNRPSSTFYDRLILANHDFQSSVDDSGLRVHKKTATATPSAPLQSTENEQHDSEPKSPSEEDDLNESQVGMISEGLTFSLEHPIDENRHVKEADQASE